MVIDRASVFADRFKGNPQLLQAAVLGQSPVPGLDPYTALRALQLIKEDQSMRMAQMAQQPTSSPSLVQSAMQMPQMPSQMPPQMPPQMAPQAAPQGMASGGLAALPSGSHDYAGGGIVAFADRGLVDGEEDDTTQGDGSPGDPKQYARSQVSLDAIMQRILSDPRVQRMTPTQRQQFVADYMREHREAGGANPYDIMRQDIEATRGERAKSLEQAQGMALLEASAAALQPGGTMRGLAGAAAAFGGSYGRALQADRAEKRALAQMQFQLADAERKERMGMYREARMAADAADKSAAEAARDARTRDIEAAKIEVGRLKATRPAGAGRPPAPPKLAEQLAAAEVAFENNPTEENARNLAGLRRAMDRARTSDIGPGRAGAALAGPKVQAEKNVADALRTFKLTDKQYKKAKQANDTATMDRLLAEETARLKSVFSVLNPEAADTAPPPGAPAAAPARAADPLGIR